MANNFLVFKRPDTKIMLNNEGDGINLLTPDNKVEDSMIFEKAPLNQSYNKSNSAWNWSTTATPGSENIITTLAKTTKTTANTLSKSKKSDNNKTETATADLSQNAGSSTDSTSSLQAGSGQANPMLLFFIALATAIVLGVAVLFIKLKFKKNVRT